MTAIYRGLAWSFEMAEAVGANMVLLFHALGWWAEEKIEDRNAKHHSV